MDRNELIEQNLRLVHACAHRFAGKGIEYEELFSAGCLGLSKAINRFDESRDLQFSTYAFPVIMGELKRLFRDGGTVKVSRSLRELSLKAARLNSESLRENGTELSVSQLAQKLQVSTEKIVEALGSAKAPLSLTAEYDEDGSPQLDIPAPDIQDEITERLSLEQALNALDEQDRRLIILRYYKSKTQSETARLLGISQVQVSRKEKKILAQIRLYLNSSHLIVEC